MAIAYNLIHIIVSCDIQNKLQCNVRICVKQNGLDTIRTDMI